MPLMFAEYVDFVSTLMYGFSGIKIFEKSGYEMSSSQMI